MREFVETLGNFGPGGLGGKIANETADRVVRLLRAPATPVKSSAPVPPTHASTEDKDSATLLRSLLDTVKSIDRYGC